MKETETLYKLIINRPGLGWAVLHRDQREFPALASGVWRAPSDRKWWVGVRGDQTPPCEYVKQSALDMMELIAE